MDDAHKLLREGWYGPRRADTSRLVAISYSEPNKYIERDQVLTGSVENFEDVPVIYEVGKGARAVSTRGDADTNNDGSSDGEDEE